jgi:PhnB protein
MQFQPYLFFGGNCAEAMTTYEKVLGAKMQMMMKYSDTPKGPEPADGCAALPPGMGDKIAHAAIELDGGMLMASDSVPLDAYQGMKHVYVTISFPTVERAKEVFDALSQNGKIEMPMGETFWVESFGSLVDRFGTGWMINGGKPKF